MSVAAAETAAPRDLAYAVLLFYHITALDDPAAECEWQQALCERLGLTGRLRVAPAGLNATLTGLRSALDQLADDGPSAFKNPAKVVEYVMLNLQHHSEYEDVGLDEAFRFTARPAGQSSFVSGLPLSSKRLSSERYGAKYVMWLSRSSREQ